LDSTSFFPSPTIVRPSKDEPSPAIAISHHVRHGHVLGRAASGSVYQLLHAATTKDTLLILICRTLTAITVALSVPVHMGLINAYYVAFIYEKVVTLRALPEIWRLVSPFFITGPKFGLLMDPYFLWTYSSQLELEASRFSQPGDFFTYIIFVCSVILVSLAHFPLFQARRSFLFAHTFFFFFFFFPSHKQPPLLPGQFILAATVPRWEGNHLCTVRRSSFAKY